LGCLSQCASPGRHGCPCILRRGWLNKLLEELHKPGVGVVAPQIRSIECPSATTFGPTIRDRELGVECLHRQGDQPYPVPLAGYACMVMTREFFEAAGGFEPMCSYGMEDVELRIRCWLLAYSVMAKTGMAVSIWRVTCRRKQSVKTDFSHRYLGRLQSESQGDVYPDAIYPAPVACGRRGDFSLDTNRGKLFSAT